MKILPQTGIYAHCAARGPSWKWFPVTVSENQEEVYICVFEAENKRLEWEANNCKRQR